MRIAWRSAAVAMAWSGVACLPAFSSDPPYSLTLALLPFTRNYNVDINYLVGSGLQLRIGGSSGQVLDVTQNGSATVANLSEGGIYVLEIVRQPTNPVQSCYFGGQRGMTALTVEAGGDTLARLECGAVAQFTRPSIPGIILANQSLRIQFNRSMLIGSCFEVASPAPLGPILSTAWVTTAFPNDTLRLDTTGWSVSNPNPYTLNLDGCRDAEGFPADTQPGFIDIYVFDSARTRMVAPFGNDGNPGTASDPQRTIQHALNELQLAFGPLGCAVGPPCAVLVSGGESGATYTESIVMLAGANVVGGYDQNFELRDVAAFATSIRPPVATCAGGGGAALNDPCATVAFPPAATGLTSLQGFSIYAHDTGAFDYTTAVWFPSGTLSGNYIYGADATSLSSGVFIPGQTAQLLNNVIDGGDAPQSAAVLILNPGASSPVLQSNFLRGGRGTISSHGILATGGSRAIVNSNVIECGQGSPGCSGVFVDGVGAQFQIINNIIGAGETDGSTTDARGIELRDSGANLVEIYHNLIAVNSNSNARGIVNSRTGPASNPNIRNNFISSDDSCYYEDSAGVAPAAFNNNVLLCDVLLAPFMNPNITNLADLIAWNASYSNTQDLPVFVDNVEPGIDLHLDPSTPCSIVGGGDPSVPVVLDFDFLPRTVALPLALPGVSIGPYEQDTGCL